MSDVAIDTSGLNRLAQKIAGARSAMSEAAEAGLQEGLTRTANWIQQNELSGQILNQRSGRLSSSIGHPTVERAGDILIGTISSVWYGKIHEYGGTFAARKKNSYTMTFPERAWLRPGIEHNKPMIRDVMTAAVLNALKNS